MRESFKTPFSCSCKKAGCIGSQPRRVSGMPSSLKLISISGHGSAARGMRERKQVCSPRVATNTVNAKADWLNVDMTMRSVSVSASNQVEITHT